MPPQGFDTTRPPSTEDVDECVHCGFCLPACPTYVLGGEEMDSPRGRIHLVKLVQEGHATLDDTVRTHFDRCLGCLACMTACPSGVKYDNIVEQTRAQLERHRPRPATEGLFVQALLTMVHSRTLLRLAALGGWVFGPVAKALGPALPGPFAQAPALLPPVSLGSALRDLPERTPARGPVRARVGLVAGCIQSVYFQEVNAASVRVLAAEGCEVIVPPTAGCCGALAAHAGQDEAARDQARRLIAAFEGAEVDHVVFNAAGCGAHGKRLQHLLHDDPDWSDRARAFDAKAIDLLELLDRLGPVAPRQPVPLRVAYHDACHLSHGQGIRRAPRDLLSAIPGLEVLELEEPDLCCGSAGIYNLLQPEAATALGERKAAHVAATTPDLLTAANPGCLLQLGRYVGVPTAHPVALLDWSISGSPGTTGLKKLPPPASDAPA